MSKKYLTTVDQEMFLISIFIMYSNDRFEALGHTLSCLRDMPLYENCQKTIVVDGKIESIPPEWEVLQVPRIDNKFCWGRMWDAGVLSARFEKIVYLDSDRLLPKEFLQLVDKNIKDNVFIFTSIHLMMNKHLDIQKCKNTLEDFSKKQNCNKFNFILEQFKFETRHAEPYHGPSKNVMSGSTSFTRKTYIRLGGVDQWYCGHGAFADNDFHMQAALNGCNFIDLSIPEIHYHHFKLSQENNRIKDKDLFILGLNNFIYYCKKWNLPIALAESLAVKCEIKNPVSYVNKKLKELEKSVTVAMPYFR